MMSSGVLMSLGVEQGNALPVALVPGDVKSMSFAQSFSELAAGTVKPEGKMQSSVSGGAELLLCQKVAPAVDRSEKFSAGSIGVRVKLQTQRDPSDFKTRGNPSTLASPSLANDLAEIVTVPGSDQVETLKNTAPTGDMPVSVRGVKGLSDESSADHTTTMADDSLSKAEVKRLVDYAMEPAAEIAKGEIEDAAKGKVRAPLTESETEAASTQRESPPLCTEPLVVPDRLKTATLKPTAEGKKTSAVAPAKREEKSKGNSAVATATAKSTDLVTDVPAALIAATAPQSGMPPAIAEPRADSEALKADKGVAPGSVLHVAARAKVETEGRGAKDRVFVGKETAKSEREVGTFRGSDIPAATEKGSTGHGKTAPVGMPGATAPMAKAGVAGEVATTPAVHGIPVSPPHVGAEGFSKPHTSEIVPSAAGRQGGPVANDTPAPASVPASEGHRTLSATPTTLEVGVANGTHGWLKVRAELGNDGVVNASLSAASSAGQEMLHRELPSLAAYLQGERVGMNAVVLHASTGEAGSQQFGHGMDGDLGRGQMRQNGAQGGEGQRGTEGTVFSDRAEEGFSLERLNEMGSTEWLAPAIYGGGMTGNGGWLNVLA